MALAKEIGDYTGKTNLIFPAEAATHATDSKRTACEKSKMKGIKKEVEGETGGGNN